jgi:hypothetical protein
VKPSVLGLLVLLVAVVGVIRLRSRSSVATPTRLAPAGVVHADTIVRFSWHAVRGATRYTVDVANEDGIPVASAATLGDTTIDVSTLALTRGAEYRWSVTAADSHGHVSRSKPVVFTVVR